MIFSLFITCPKGIESLLQNEIEALGATQSRQTVGGVHCQSSLESLYQICLWSRLANRVLLLLFTGSVKDSPMCYQLSHDFDWSNLIHADSTLSVHFTGQSPFMRNTVYGAQLIKDSIVDKLRETTGRRCDIDPDNANCKIQARLHHGELSVYYDLSGGSLHQRGYRKQAGAAPLKENLAAALLLRADWPKRSADKQPLIDPCCGSGTLLIEAAMIATDKAPALEREEFGFMYWRGHDDDLWRSIRKDAMTRHDIALEQPPIKILGFDADLHVLSIAKRNIERSGLSQFIECRQGNIRDFRMPADLHEQKGLIIANPPYGERLTDSAELIPLYQDLGLALAEQAQGWQAAIFTADPLLAKAIGLRSHKQYSFFNGAIPCQLYLFDMQESNKSNVVAQSAHAEMILNRLKKNERNLASWRKQNDITAYRLYDADMPEYAFAIDIYNDWAHVQEYKAPSEIPVEKTQQRLLDVLQVLPKAIDLPRDHIVIKERKKQKGSDQYERQDDTDHRIIVKEGSAEFYVNCHDYLDTGLFLDHRLLRRMIFNTAKGKDFLNLFCYTATASIQASLGGANKTVNVDMSKTYLEWAKDNFRLNKQTIRDQLFIQENCLEWIGTCEDRFDMILLDPPSFSNSKRMEGVLDIQRDHAMLIEKSMKLLKPNGILYFSTNFRRFKLDEAISQRFKVTDITMKTIDKDFARDAKIHRCFIITTDPTP